MGDRVQVGNLIYTVMETNWKSQLTDDPASTAPRNRFLIVKMTITNAGKDDSPIPPMTLTSSSGQTYPEVIEVKDDLPLWFGGLLRQLKAAQSETGVVVFDAPLAAYKLKVTDGGDIDQEKYALIDIPLQLQ